MTQAIPAGVEVTADEFALMLPGRKETVTETTDQTFTGSEVVIDTIETDPDILLIGQRYRVVYKAEFSGVANEQARIRIRRDSGAGTILRSVRRRLVVFPDTELVELSEDFVADATSATFVVTGQRMTGTGTVTRRGSSEQTVYLWVEKA